MTMRTPRLRTSLTLLRLAAVYVSFLAMKRIVPLQTLVRRAWRTPGGRSTSGAADAIAGVMRLRRLRGASRGDCLESALVLYRELSSRGQDPVLVVGFRRWAGRTQGHTWVEVAGCAVAESNVELGAFTRTIAFGRAGRPVAVE
jgi:hypothetical protein